MTRKVRRLRFAGRGNGPLEHNHTHQFAARHALRHYASNSVYSFIPKNACSTLRLTLAVGNGCIPDASRHVWIHANNTTFTADLAALATADFTFVILRDPLARLASVYLDKIVNRDRDLWHLYDILDRSIEPDAITFRKFADFVCRGSIIRANLHWRPQVDFLVYEDYDLWVPLERFSAHVPEIEQQTGLQIADARSLTKHGSDQYATLSEEPAADLSPATIRQMQAQGSSPSHAALYDDDLKARVAAAYADDIAVYRKRFGAELPLLSDSMESAVSKE